MREYVVWWCDEWSCAHLFLLHWWKLQPPVTRSQWLAEGTLRGRHVAFEWRHTLSSWENVCFFFYTFYYAFEIWASYKVHAISIYIFFSLIQSFSIMRYRRETRSSWRSMEVTGTRRPLTIALDPSQSDSPLQISVLSYQTIFPFTSHLARVKNPIFKRLANQEPSLCEAIKGPSDP